MVVKGLHCTASQAWLQLNAAIDIVQRSIVLLLLLCSGLP